MIQDLFLQAAIEQAKTGLASGGIPIGSVLYRRATLYSTLSPCDMCSGAILLYKIPRVIIGENRTFRGPEDYLRSRGVEIEVVDHPECVRLMRDFIRNNPVLWNEDIAVMDDGTAPVEEHL